MRIGRLRFVVRAAEIQRATQAGSLETVRGRNYPQKRIAPCRPRLGGIAPPLKQVRLQLNAVASTAHPPGGTALSETYALRGTVANASAADRVPQPRSKPGAGRAFQPRSPSAFGATVRDRTGYVAPGTPSAARPPNLRGR